MHMENVFIFNFDYRPLRFRAAIVNIFQTVTLPKRPISNKSHSFRNGNTCELGTTRQKFFINLCNSMRNGNANQSRWTKSSVPDKSYTLRNVNAGQTDTWTKGSFFNSSYTIMNDNTGQIIATTECAFVDYCHATRNFDMSNTSILKSTFSDKFYTVWKIDAG